MRGVCLGDRTAGNLRGAAAIAFASLGLLLVAFAPVVQAQNLEEVFKGKTVRILVPTATGGDRALYTIPVATYMGRHLPGNPTVVPVFMPGAGGALAVNNVFSIAAPDGLTIATPLAPVVIAQATGDPSVKYDVRKMSWIGRTADANGIMAVWHTTPFKSVDDLKTQEAIVGTTGNASVTWINPQIMNKMIGTKFKMVQGYSGTGDTALAMERAETHGLFTTWSNLSNNHAEWVRDGKVRILLQVGLSRHPDLPKIPTMGELAPNEEARQVIDFMSSSSQMGQSFVGPPGLPASILAALRTAFDNTMKDRDFLETARKAGLQINPMNGATLTEVVLKTIDAPPAIIERYRAALVVK